MNLNRIVSACHGSLPLVSTPICHGHRGNTAAISLLCCVCSGTVTTHPVARFTIFLTNFPHSCRCRRSPIVLSYGGWYIQNCRSGCFDLQSAFAAIEFCLLGSSKHGSCGIRYWRFSFGNQSNEYCLPKTCCTVFWTCWAVLPTLGSRAATFSCADTGVKRIDPARTSDVVSNCSDCIVRRDYRISTRLSIMTLSSGSVFTTL